MDNFQHSFTKFLGIFCIVSLTSPLVFSQTTKNINLESCLDAALSIHPLQQKKELLLNAFSTKEKVNNTYLLPGIEWKAQAKIQSESIGLEFDNPMFPSIDIPIYSAQSTLDINYSIYNGGLVNKQNALNKATYESELNSLESKIDQVKAEVVKIYIGLLFSDEKSKVLKNALEKINDNISRLESAQKHGVVQKHDVLQLKVQAMDIESKILGNKEDRKAMLKVMESLTGLQFDNAVSLNFPELTPFDINQDINKKELQQFDLEKKVLNEKVALIQASTKPRVFAFGTAGTGYPNPLNFFDDNISLFAVGGIGFSWKFLDWGKAEEEKKLIRIQQDILETHKNELQIKLNRYNENFQIRLSKFQKLANKESELLEMREEIAQIQKNRLEKGVIVAVEYLNTLNDIIDSELKLSQYQLEQVKTKLEYLLLKGKI